MATINPYSFTTKNNKIITIRNCEDSDIPGLPNFLNSIAKESTHTMLVQGNPAPSSEKTKLRWNDFKLSKKGLMLGAFDKDLMVGQLFVAQEWEDHPWALHVAKFATFILQDYWGNGIGREFLKIIDDHSKKVDLFRIEAHVRAKNERAIALYLKCGFQIEGLRKNAAFINNEFQDEYFIGKNIV